MLIQSSKVPGLALVILETIMTGNEQMLWASDTDSPVQLAFYTTKVVEEWSPPKFMPPRHGTTQVLSTPVDYIKGQLRGISTAANGLPSFLDELGEDTQEAAKYLLLLNLFSNHREHQQRVYVKPIHGKKSEYELVLLIQVEEYWVGIQTMVVW